MSKFIEVTEREYDRISGWEPADKLSINVDSITWFKPAANRSEWQRPSKGCDLALGGYPLYLIETYDEVREKIQPDVFLNQPNYVDRPLGTAKWAGPDIDCSSK